MTIGRKAEKMRKKRMLTAVAVLALTVARVRN